MTSTTMNEMASGCCVCSDERGWTENPLVYCDGVGCNIGVHKACYGIVTVPSGNWYCRKCESQERSARVRCELCPSKDGALKRTDTNGWAHVVCGLYIPEVRFGSVTTMEPILIAQIPVERFNKVCYICEKNNRGRASVGACMECNKVGCKQQFHVTCAQTLGLLCEEPGNYMDNVKYCGYCQEHYMKIRKNSNVKTIPPYKPASVNNAGSDGSSPEKKLSNFNQITTDLKQTSKRKSVSSRPLAVNGPSKLSSKESQSHQPSVDNVNGTRNMTPPSPNAHSQLMKERTSSVSNGSASNISPVPQMAVKAESNSRFTTSNFVESVITPSESVFAEVQKNTKKRKMSETTLASVPSVSLPSIVGGPSSPHLLKQQQSSASTTTTSTTLTTEPLQMDLERTNSKLNADQDHDNDNDDDDEDDDGDAGELKFIEEPNLSSLKPDANPSSASTNETTNISSTVLPGTLSMSVTFSQSKLPTPNSSVSASTVSKTTATNVKTESASAVNPVTSSYLSTTRASTPEVKTSKFQNGSNAPHMLGNQLNPTSSVAQKMFDSLNDELEAHSIFTPSESTNPNNFVGPPLYNKIISSTRTKETKKNSLPSNGGPLASLSGSAASFPQTLEELLEKQWEQGGTFLMEQAQHFDIASLLTCLHKLREENLELEEHIRKLKARRDHLLGVNARLAMPLAPISQPVNNIHSLSQTSSQQSSTPTSQQSVSQHLGLHHQMSHQSQLPPLQQSSTVQVPLQPPTHHNVSHSQVLYPQANANPSLCGSGGGGNSNTLSDSGQLRNIQLPSNIYLSAANINLRSPQNAVYQNPHPIENGPMTHHQHARVMSVMSAGGNRHHSSASNTPMYATNQHLQQQQQQQQQQSANPGVVVRTSNLPMSEVGRNDRRNSTVMSNY